MAQLAADEDGDEARNVAAGCAVLAGIAASDAICCVLLRQRHRGQDHKGAIALLRKAPGGAKAADALAKVLNVKDHAHYGMTFVGNQQLRTTLRAAEQLVDAAATVTEGGPLPG